MGGRLNLDVGTLNLDGGTRTLDGGTRPPYNLSTDYTLSGPTKSNLRPPRSVGWKQWKHWLIEAMATG